MGMTLWGWVILLGLASCGQTSQETWATYQQAFSYIPAVAWRGGRRRRCLPRPHRLSCFSLHAPCPGQGFPLSASSMACVLSSRGACAEESGASGLLWPPRISPAGHVPSEWQAVLILFNCLAPVPFGAHASFIYVQRICGGETPAQVASSVLWPVAPLACGRRLGGAAETPPPASLRARYVSRGRAEEVTDSAGDYASLSARYVSRGHYTPPGSSENLFLACALRARGKR